MAILVWTGAALTLLGVAGVVWSLVAVLGARRAGLGDDAIRARLRTAVPVNVAAFLVSLLGLGLVVVGLAVG